MQNGNRKFGHNQQHSMNRRPLAGHGKFQLPTIASHQNLGIGNSSMDHQRNSLRALNDPANNGIRKSQIVQGSQDVYGGKNTDNSYV